MKKHYKDTSKKNHQHEKQRTKKKTKIRSEAQGGSLGEQSPETHATHVVEVGEGACRPPHYPCAIATAWPFVFTASTAPSLEVWKRPDGERGGRSAALALRSRCLPLRTWSGGRPETGPRGSAPGPMMPGEQPTALENAKRSLERDALRHAGCGA